MTVNPSNLVDILNNICMNLRRKNRFEFFAEGKK